MTLNPTVNRQPSTVNPKPAHIESIDLLRGIVIVIMAIDHVRDYFHADKFLFDATDLTKTNAAIFFTRWITHFCAPAFVFLAGTSAAIVSQRKSTAELSKFLFTRGLWLVFLELTVINLFWYFNPSFSFFSLGVIWALGISMIALSLLIHLPPKVILVIGLIILFGHNLLDSITVDGNSPKAFAWAVLHVSRRFEFGYPNVNAQYPVLPWIGIMALGYATGSLYKREILPAVRKKYLLTIGLSAIALFIIIRAINVYGDISPWSVQGSQAFTMMSFLNTTKYPPSLLYSLMTLGPALVFLALMEKPLGRWAQPLLHFGRVPMFFYILHLLLIHLLATIAIIITEGDWHDTIIRNGFKYFHPQFSLGVVYLVWIAVILMLYPLCKWYDEYKMNNKDKWWLSYL
jgi:uncharacterized membrane protein